MQSSKAKVPEQSLETVPPSRPMRWFRPCHGNRRGPPRKEATSVSQKSAPCPAASQASETSFFPRTPCIGTCVQRQVKCKQDSRLAAREKVEDSKRQRPGSSTLGQKSTRWQKLRSSIFLYRWDLRLCRPGVTFRRHGTDGQLTGTSRLVFQRYCVLRLCIRELLQGKLFEVFA